MVVLVIYLVSLFAAVGVCGLVCLSDIRGLKIPNIYSLYVSVSFFVAYGVVYFGAPEVSVFGSLLHHLLSALAFFAVTFVLFALGLLGAGDSKFGAACALWFSLKYLPIYLFFMTLFGGILGLVTLYMRYKKPFKSPAHGSWVQQAQGGVDKVPYGVAIAFGVLATFIHAAYFSPAVLASFV
ncbi:MAG: prepilin peptidase [Alphaproteobacteria bacterium]